jgi:Fe2+ transport system protein FeoA
VVPLSLIDSGHRARLHTVCAGRELTARLASMGLVPGTELEVISKSTKGPLIVSVGDTRLVLGRGMVSKILVSP